MDAFLLVGVMLYTSLSLGNANELAHGEQLVPPTAGFNDDINWVTFEKGLEIANTENKPLMLLIHKSWCGACNALKPQFATSIPLLEESRNFVMVNLQDDDAPTDNAYAPDGAYIPRIFFLRPDGTIMTEIFNKEGNQSYIYYYSTVEAIMKSMSLARQKVIGGPEDGEL